MARVLVVDDEENITASLRYVLGREGYGVTTSSTGSGAIEAVRRERQDLLVLDIMLPDLSGLDVCREVRRGSSVPIIMLTAREDEVDKVVGLELGADDYVTKPFGMRELVARVRAQLRRAEGGTPGEAQPVTVGGISLDPRSRRVLVDGEAVSLQPKEFDLLACLARQPDRVYSRRQLLELVWGSASFIDARTVDVHVRWLRRKIEPDPARPRYLETVRGAGYRLRGGW